MESDFSDEIQKPMEDYPLKSVHLLMKSSPLKTCDDVRQYLATGRVPQKFGPPQPLTWNYGNTITMRLVPDENKPRALVPQLVVENNFGNNFQSYCFDCLEVHPLGECTRIFSKYCNKCKFHFTSRYCPSNHK